MAFPSIAGTQTSVETASVAAHDVTLPASVAADDILIAWVFQDGASGGFSWPAGWTEVLDSAVVSTEASVTVGWRRATGGETTVQVTSVNAERSTHIAVRITGAHTTTAPEFSATATGTSANPNPDSLNPTNWDVEDTLWIAWQANDLQATTVFPYANNNVSTSTTDVTSASYGAICSTESAVASIDPGTFTIGASDQWRAGTIAVRPAGSSTINLTPTPIAVPVSVPAPTFATSLAFTPAPIAAPVVVPAPTFSTSLSLAPAPITIPVAVPAPTFATSLSLAPAPVPVVLVVTDSTLGAPPITLAPDPVAVVVSVPAPTFGLSLSFTPAPVSIPVAVPASTLATSLSLAPAPVAIPVVVPAPTLATSLSLAPAPIPVVVAVTGSVLDQGAITLAPAPVAVVVSVPGPALATSLSLAPAPIPVPVAVPAPAFGTVYTIAPAPVAVAFAITVPGLSTPLTLAPDPVAVVVSLPAPTFTGGAEFIHTIEWDALTQFNRTQFRYPWYGRGLRSRR